MKKLGIFGGRVIIKDTCKNYNKYKNVNEHC